VPYEICSLATRSRQHRAGMVQRYLQAIPEGLAQATAEREKPIGVFGLLRRLITKDGRRGLAAAIDFLQAFGRHLQSDENPLPLNRF